MNVRNDQTRNFVELIVCMLIIVGIMELITRTDTTIREKRQSAKFLSNSFLPQGQPFMQDEMRISNLFVEDTLPRLIQYGLVKRYELTQYRTVLFVNGKLWKQTSQFFKDSLLTEILVHNKINGYAPDTRVVDNRSRKLCAAISSSTTFAFFD